MEAFPIADMIFPQRAPSSERGGCAGGGVSSAQGLFYELLYVSGVAPDASRDEEVFGDGSTGEKLANLGMLQTLVTTEDGSTGEKQAFCFCWGDTMGEDEEIPGGGGHERIITHQKIFGEDGPGTGDETDRLDLESVSEVVPGLPGGVVPLVLDPDGPDSATVRIFPEGTSPCLKSHGVGVTGGKTGEFPVFSVPFEVSAAFSPLSGRGVPEGPFRLSAPSVLEVFTPDAMDGRVPPAGAFSEEPAHSTAPGSGVDGEDASIHSHSFFPGRNVLLEREKVSWFSDLDTPGRRQEGAEVGRVPVESGLTDRGAFDAAHAQRISAQTSRLDSDSSLEVVALTGEGERTFFPKSEGVSSRSADGRSRFQDMVPEIFEEEANSHDPLRAPSAKGLSGDRKGDTGGLVSSGGMALDAGEMHPDEKVPVHATGFGKVLADVDQTVHGIAGARVVAADARVSGVPDAGASIHGLDGGRILRSAEETIVHAFHVGRKDAILHVEPPDMGRIRIHISMAESGMVDVHLSAEHPEVMAVLNSNLDGLRSQLDERGVPLGRMDVSAGGDSGGFAGNDPGWDQEDQWPGPHYSGEKVRAGHGEQVGYEGGLRGEGLHLVI